jgi:serine/threonine protein kinase
MAATWILIQRWSVRRTSWLWRSSAAPGKILTYLYWYVVSCCGDVCRCTEKGDVWSVGCTVVQMLTGEPPWKQYNICDIVQLCRFLQSWPGGPPISPRTISPALDTFLHACFSKRPATRSSVEELLGLEVLNNKGNIDSCLREDSYDYLGDEAVLWDLTDRDITDALSRELTKKNAPTRRRSMSFAVGVGGNNGRPHHPEATSHIHFDGTSAMSILVPADGSAASSSNCLDNGQNCSAKLKLQRSLGSKLVSMLYCEISGSSLMPALGLRGHLIHSQDHR